MAALAELLQEFALVGRHQRPWMPPGAPEDRSDVEFVPGAVLTEPFEKIQPVVHRARMMPYSPVSCFRLAARASSGHHSSTIRMR